MSKDSLNNLKIRQSVVLSIAAISLLTFLVGGTMFFVTVFSVSDLTRAADGGTTDLAKQNALVRSLSQLHSNLQWLASEKDISAREVRTEVVNGFITDFDTRLADCGKHCDAVLKTFNDYKLTWKNILAHYPNVQTAAQLEDFRKAVFTDLNPIAEKLFDNLDTVVAAVTLNAKSNFKTATQHSYFWLTISGFGLFIISLLTLFFFLNIKSKVLDPLENLREVLQRAQTDLDVRFSLETINMREFIEIGNTFNEMMDSLKKNEATILQQHESIIQTSKLASLGEMAAGVAHEINNPLAIIEGTARLLPKYKDEPEVFRQKMEIINRAVKRVSKIVLGLRRFSRSSIKSDLKVYALQPLFEEIVSLVEPKAKHDSTPVELVGQLSDIQIRCNDIEFEQVFINLINNGIDAVKKSEDRWVKVTIESTDTSVKIYVRDSGKGIPKAVADKLFQPFFTTKAVGEGTGLGLSIVKGIIDEHQGTIELKHDDPNTCFLITMPRAREVAHAA